MNEFTAKKLGEVMAFANVGKEIFEKGRVGLEKVVSNKDINQLLHDISEHQVALNDLTDGLGFSEVSQGKCEKTSEKLRKMTELYIGEEWDNPAELLEWLGFFEGAALIHWKLVSGAGDALEHTEIQKLAKVGVDFHKKLLDNVGKKITIVGSQKALL